MSFVTLAIALHVGMGAAWAIATLAAAITGRVNGPWPVILLGPSILNMAAGIYLWHALHSGAWGTTEHLLVVGTFSAFAALGIQVPVVLAAPSDGPLKGAALMLLRVTVLLILAAATAMVASHFV